MTDLQQHYRFKWFTFPALILPVLHDRTANKDIFNSVLYYLPGSFILIPFQIENNITSTTTLESLIQSVQVVPDIEY